MTTVWVQQWDLCIVSFSNLIALLCVIRWLTLNSTHNPPPSTITKFSKLLTTIPIPEHVRVGLRGIWGSHTDGFAWEPYNYESLFISHFCWVSFSPHIPRRPFLSIQLSEVSNSTRLGWRSPEKQPIPLSPWPCLHIVWSLHSVFTASDRKKKNTRWALQAVIG